MHLTDDEESEMDSTLPVEVALSVNGTVEYRKMSEDYSRLRQQEAT